MRVCTSTSPSRGTGIAVSVHSNVSAAILPWGCLAQSHWRFMASILVAGGTLLQVRHDRLELVGRADQLLLLDRLRQKSRLGVGPAREIEQPLGRARGVWTLAGDFPGGLERPGARVAH